MSHRKTDKFIYIIRHPKTFTPVYIGVSDSPFFRLSNHRKSKNNQNLKNWILNIENVFGRVNLKILNKKLDYNRCFYIEKILIRRFIKKGKVLFNRGIS